MSENAPWGILLGDYLSDDPTQTIPVILPTTQGGFQFRYHDTEAEQAQYFLEHIILNFAASLPLGSLHIHLWDYAIKKRFPYLNALKQYGIFHLASNSQSAEIAFNQMENTCRQRHQDLLNVDTPDLIHYNQNSPYLEPYHLVLIHADDYPDERTSLRRIQALHTAAAEAGIYFLVFGTGDTGSQHHARNYLLKTLPQIDFQRGELTLPDSFPYQQQLGKFFPFERLSINQQSLLQHFAEQAEAAKTEETMEEYLNIPIGMSLDNRQPFYLTLGGKVNNHHILLTGMTGTGKTNFINNLIIQIGEKYSAKAFRLYLMDYKRGTEFKLFQHHPNVEKLFLDNEDIAAAEKLLTDFVGICQERTKLFNHPDINVRDISEYNRKFPNNPIPRILLIVDEFQVMFGDWERSIRINALLNEVARQGRAFGIHMLLATQTLSGVAIKSEVSNQIGLRLTFKVQDMDSAMQIMKENNIHAPQNLEIHQLLYNDKGGNIDGNQICRTDKAPDIDLSIARIRASRSANECLTPEIVTIKKEEREQPSAYESEISQTFSTLGDYSAPTTDHRQEMDDMLDYLKRLDAEQGENDNGEKQNESKGTGE